MVSFQVFLCIICHLGVHFNRLWPKDWYFRRFWPCWSPWSPRRTNLHQLGPNDGICGATSTISAFLRLFGTLWRHLTPQGLKLRHVWQLWPHGVFFIVLCPKCIINGANNTTCGFRDPPAQFVLIFSILGHNGTHVVPTWPFSGILGSNSTISDFCEPQRANGWDVGPRHAMCGFFLLFLRHYGTISIDFGMAKHQFMVFECGGVQRWSKREVSLEIETYWRISA